MKTTLNLDVLLARTVGEVTLFGRQFGVKSLDGAGAQTLESMRGDGQPDLATLYGIAQRHLVPVLTDEEAGRLTADVVGLIIAAASKGVQSVENALPNYLTLTTSGPSSASTSESSESASASGLPAAG